MMRKYLFFFLMFVAASGFSLQSLTAIDNATVHGLISASEYNRIYVQGDRILRFTSSHGQYALEEDAGNGQIFIKPYPDTKRIMGFITTENQHYYPIDLKSITGTMQTLVLLPPVAASDKAAHWERSTSYESALLHLMQAMAEGRVPEGYMVLATSSDVANLNAFVRLRQIKAYTGDKFLGLVFALHNKSNQAIELLPSDLYKQGVLAVSLASNKIAPLSDTLAYVVVKHA